MSIARKYLYLRALLFIPVGLVAFQLGTKELIGEVKKSKDSYLNLRGSVHAVTDTTMFNEKRATYYDATKVVIEDSIFYSRITKFRNLIDANLKVYDQVIVYYRRDEGLNKIKALYMGEEPIIAYKNVYWVGVFFIVFGLVLFLLSIGAVLSGIKTLLRGEEP